MSLDVNWQDLNRERDAAIAVARDLNVSEGEWVAILLRYTTEARLRVALPLLAVRCPGRKFKHRELAAFVGHSREKVTCALKRLRASGEYRDEVTSRGHL